MIGNGKKRFIMPLNIMKYAKDYHVTYIVLLIILTEGEIFLLK
jgi:hypothetical protein